MAMWLAPLVYRVLGTWAMIAGIVVMVAGFLLTGVAQNPVTVGFAMFLAAGGSGVSDVLANAEVSEAESATGRSLMNLNHGLFSVAYAVAAVSVGFAREAGFGPFVVFCGMTLVVAIWMIWLRLPERSLPPEDAGKTLDMPYGLVWVGGFVVLAAFLGEAASEGWSALHVERTLGGGPAEGAMGPALLGVGMALSLIHI